MEEGDDKGEVNSDAEDADPDADSSTTKNLNDSDKIDGQEDTPDAEDEDPKDDTNGKTPSLESGDDRPDEQGAAEGNQESEDLPQKKSKEGQEEEEDTPAAVMGEDEDDHYNQYYDEDTDDYYDEEYTAREHKFNLDKYVQAYAHQQVLKNYCQLLSNYKTNSLETNGCILRFFEKLASEYKLPAMFFQLSIFILFDTILQDQSIRKDANFQKLRLFCKKIVRKFFDLAKANE